MNAHCPKLVADFAEAVRARDTLQARFIVASTERLTALELDDFRAYMEHCISQGETLDDLVTAYLGLVDNVMEEQLFFARHGRYRYSSLQEVEAQVYANPRYMRPYMRGVALTLYLWPQHQDIKRFFHEHFPGRTGGTYLEIGPGHGMFFLHALRQNVFDRHVGVDISPTSIAATRSLIRSSTSGATASYDLVHADFLSYTPSEPIMACVAGEVLEHVEHPELFLRKIGRCVAPNAFIFVSTCLNAPVLDHIYNFESVEKLESMLGAADLVVRERLLIPHVGRTLDQCLARKLPVSVAYLLRKPGQRGSP